MRRGITWSASLVAGLLSIAFLVHVGQSRAQATEEEKIKAYEAAMKRQAAQGFAHDARWLQDKHAPGTAEMLAKLQRKDISRIQILRLDYGPAAGEQTRRYGGRPLQNRNEDTAEIEGLLALVRRAKPYVPCRNCACAPPIDDQVLVVYLKSGDSFEIVYSSSLEKDAPFGGVYDRELKEALYTLAGKSTEVTIVHINQDRVVETLHTSLISPHGGGTYSSRLSAEFHLTEKSGLTVYLKLHDKGTVLMEDDKRLSYGEAAFYTTKAPGTDKYLVYLNTPRG